MKTKSIEELEKELAHHKQIAEVCAAEAMEYKRAEQVIVAAGLISKEKLDQAHEIVRGFKD